MSSENNGERFKELCESIRNFDTEEGRKVAKETLDKKEDLMKAIKAMSDELAEIGEKFQRGEIYLPHLVMAADVMDEVIRIFEPFLSAEEVSKSKLGTVVMGTVEGDLHDIGLNIVTMRLKTSGFEVHNLGKDVPVNRFIEKAHQVGADIVGASTLLTVTRSKLKDLVDEVKMRKLPFKVMVGGGSVPREFADRIGADGYGEDAEEAVKDAKRIMKEKGKAE